MSFIAEKSVLGGLIADNSQFQAVHQLISVDDFEDDNHKAIYKALAMRLGNGESATIADLITSNDDDIKRLSIQYLRQLEEDAVAVSNTPAYAEMLQKRTQKRLKIAELQWQIDNIDKLDLPEVEKAEAQEWQSDLSADIDFMIPEHFGVAAEIQRWILDTSVKRQPAIALAATLSILSVVVGRHRQCDGIKGNIISVCLAESGEGKDHPLKCVSKILDAIGMGDKVTGQLASGAALFEAVHRKPSIVLMLDEIGHYFTGINGKGANQYSKEIMPMITEMYTSANYQYRDKARAGREGEIVKEPNLSVIGMTTERQIIDSLRTSDVADGSLARFFVLFGNNNVLINPKSDKLSSNEIPASIILGLEDLREKWGSNDEMFLNSKLLDITDDYRDLKMKLMIDFNDKGIECGKEGTSKAIFKPFYLRLAVKAVSMSLLIDQCGSVEVLQWCADLAEKAQDIFIKKFLHLASDNENERLVKIIERAIKEAGKKGIARKSLYDKTKQVPTVQKNLIIADLIDSDKIFTQPMRINGSQKPTTVYFWRK